MRFLLIITAIILCLSSNAQQSFIDLSGEWMFTLSPQKWGEETVKLPGSMLENHKGDPITLKTPWTASLYDSSFYYNPNWDRYRQNGNIKLPFFLTPEKHYVGKAWYKRSFELDNTDGDPVLILERVHIMSTVFVNGEMVGKPQTSMSTPHRYNLKRHLKRGKNEIMICIDNDPKICGVGPDSYSITDQAQGNWNGIIGRIGIEFNPILPPYPTDSTFRIFEARGKMFYKDGKKLFLRGTVESCSFPLTGYPPMDEESWDNVMASCKRHGLNHIRFHSYCPPEAAFRAADKADMILQIEGPSWPNHGGTKLGMGQTVDKYLNQELELIIREYGHHPSFCMMATGNEPNGRWVEWVTLFTEYWRKNDPRRMYTGASVGDSWKWMPYNPFHVKAGARGLDTWRDRQPGTMDSHSWKIDTVSVPYVGHETGQWASYPHISDTIKYTGPYKATYLEIAKDQLAENGMANMGEKFFMASGKLQLLCYKYEIEKIRRTDNYAGYQMLSLNDYPGQGTALTGYTDVFYNDKEYCEKGTVLDLNNVNADVVPLIETSKFTYRANETFHAGIIISQYYADSISADIEYSLSFNGKKTKYAPIETDKMLHSGNTRIRGIDIALNNAPKSIQVTLTIAVKRHDNKAILGCNSWSFWVYPENVDLSNGNVIVTDTLDEKTQEYLMNGGKVLLTIGSKCRYGKGIIQYFTPIFWNTSWFKMSPPHTTGLYIESEHPIFKNFVTDYYSNLQWWELVHLAPVMLMSDFPKEMQPIVQPIDTWYIARKLGMLTEAKVGKGRLMITTMDINTSLDKRIVARQMRSAILKYMNSDEFKPKYDIEMDAIIGLFTKTTPFAGPWTRREAMKRKR